MIAPIGKPESDTRKRSDQILKHIIGPAAKTCGYNATWRGYQAVVGKRAGSGRGSPEGYGSEESVFRTGAIGRRLDEMLQCRT